MKDRIIGSLPTVLLGLLIAIAPRTFAPVCEFAAKHSSGKIRKLQQVFNSILPSGYCQVMLANSPRVCSAEIIRANRKNLCAPSEITYKRLPVVVFHPHRMNPQRVSRARNPGRHSPQDDHLISPLG